MEKGRKWKSFQLTGAWSIVPPLLALALALITKEVYSSLTIGVFVGMVIYQFTLNGVGVDQLVTAFTDVPNAMALQIADNGALLLFLALLGALTVVIATAGGSRAYAEWVSTHIKNARAAQVLTGLLGIIIFVDDYFNCLTVGAVMRPVTDRFHVSHEKLAWIIDSTAAPVCIIAPVSSWAVAVGGYLGDDGFTTFVQSIPYNFYALLTIFFVFFMLITNKNDYGPMRAAEAEAKTSEGAAAEGGKLLEKLSTMGLSDQAEADPDDHTNLESVVTEQADIEQSASAAIDEYKGLDISEKGKVYDLIVPILVLVFFSILGMMYTGGFFEGVDFATAVGENPVGGLCIGATVALCVAGAMFLPRGLTTLSGFVESISEGVRSMVGAIMILVLAWSLGGCCRYMLGTGDFVSSFLNSLGVSLAILPCIIFLVAGFIGDQHEEHEEDGIAHAVPRRLERGRHLLCNVRRNAHEAMHAVICHGADTRKRRFGRDRADRQAVESSRRRGGGARVPDMDDTTAYDGCAARDRGQLLTNNSNACYRRQ